MDVTLEDILNANNRISPYITRTPVFTSRTFDRKFGENGQKFFFKAENLQKTGSCKARGALNAVLCALERNSQITGVITASCGNHGQGLAWAAEMAGLKCVVLVPETVSKTKINALKEYGAEVIKCEPNPSVMIEACKKLSKEQNLHYIPSSGDHDVISGQATVALELMSQVANIDAIVVSVGAGGLASGVCLYAKRTDPDIKVFLVEPEGKLLGKCLKYREKLWPNPPRFLKTIADAISVQHVTANAWPVLLEYPERDVLSVKNEEIINAMSFVFERMKLVIEGAAAATVAASMSRRFQELSSSSFNIGVILCGGNIDIHELPW